MSISCRAYHGGGALGKQVSTSPHPFILPEPSSMLICFGGCIGILAFGRHFTFACRQHRPAAGCRRRDSGMKMTTPKARHHAAVAAVLACLVGGDFARGGFVDAAMSLDPVAYWRLGDSGPGNGNQATDRIGNHHGTYHGGVTLGSPGALADGDSAAHFDEVDDFLQIPDFSYGPRFSLAFFFRQDHRVGTSQQYLVSHSNAQHAGNDLDVFLGEGGASGWIQTNLIFDNDDEFYSLRANVSEGQWHFYTLTVSAQEGITVYLDDSVRKNSEISLGLGSVYNPSSDLYFGAVANLNPTRFFGSEDPDQGLLDEVMIFNHALTATDVANLYASRLEDAGTIPQLQAGDADQDLDFDQLDLVRVLIAGKYLSGRIATWSEGDWNGAPGGSQANPPPGDGVFDQLDIVAALQSGVYLTGPYAGMRSSASFNTSLGEPALVHVPEPAAAEILICGLCWTLLSYRRGEHRLRRRGAGAPNGMTGAVTVRVASNDLAIFDVELSITPGCRTSAGFFGVSGRGVDCWRPNMSVLRRYRARA